MHEKEKFLISKLPPQAQPQYFNRPEQIIKNEVFSNGNAPKYEYEGNEDKPFGPEFGNVVVFSKGESNGKSNGS